MSLLNHYETMFIIAPTLGPDAYERLVETFKGIIEENGGKVHNTTKWGVRTLAYEVKKFKEGIYTIFDFEAPGDLIQELERRLRLNDSVLKYLTVKSERKDKLVKKGAARRNAQDAKKKRTKPAPKPARERDSRGDRD